MEDNMMIFENIETLNKAQNMVNRAKKAFGIIIETHFTKHDANNNLFHLWIDTNNKKFAYYNEQSKVLLFHSL
jgi:hypothetical protein